MPRAVAICLTVVALALGACGNDDSDTASVATTPGADDFTTLDASGDSYLDADEIAEWVDDRGPFRSWDEDADSELDRDEITGNAFSLWDSDNNGKISQPEWERGTDLWYPKDTEVRVYSDWDGDGDSEIDADEFKEEFDSSALGESWRTDTLSADTFKKAYFELYDVDDDGRVSLSEWTGGSRTFGIAE